MNIGFALCGSFCTYSAIFPVMEELAKVHTLIPILSPAASSTDTRFGTAQSNKERIQAICGEQLFAGLTAEQSHILHTTLETVLINASRLAEEISL